MQKNCIAQAVGVAAPTKQNAPHHPKAVESAQNRAYFASTAQHVNRLACGWLANRGRIGTKPKGLGLKNPVCEDTFDSAVAALTEKKGFVSSKFWGLVRLHGFHMVYGGMGHTARLAAWLNPCLQHPVHLLRVKTQSMVPKSHSGASTMFASKGQAVPTPTPTARTAAEVQAHALLQAMTSINLAGFYVRRDNIAQARRKLRQALQALGQLEGVAA